MSRTTEFLDAFDAYEDAYSSGDVAAGDLSKLAKRLRSASRQVRGAPDILPGQVCRRIGDLLDDACPDLDTQDFQRGGLSYGQGVTAIRRLLRAHQAQAVVK